MPLVSAHRTLRGSVPRQPGRRSRRAQLETINVRLAPEAHRWSALPKPKDVDALLKGKAHKAHAADSDGCGTFDLAEASVAVLFVGAAAGAVAIAQVIRLCSMLQSIRIMQMDLGSPEMVMTGGLNEPPEASVGK